MAGSRKSLTKRAEANRQSDNAVIAQHIVSVESSFSGPVPPADELRKYAEIDVNLVDRIFTMAENEQKQSQKTETRDSRGAFIAITATSLMFPVITIGALMI
jgi:uncharacterized membrane protein